MLQRCLATVGLISLVEVSADSFYVLVWANITVTSVSCTSDRGEPWMQATGRTWEGGQPPHYLRVSRNGFYAGFGAPDDFAQPRADVL